MGSFMIANLLCSAVHDKCQEKNALILYGLFNTFVTLSSEYNWNS